MDTAVILIFVMNMAQYAAKGYEVGVANDGTLIGAGLDAEWLRQRIFELTHRLLTVDVSEVQERETRLPDRPE